MSASIYDQDHYRPYLVKALNEGEAARGRRSRLAAYLQCQTSYISQVLTERTHLSLEHAIRVSDFLAHSPDERHFFMLLIQKDKAGNRELESYYQDQISQVRKRRQTVRERIKVTDELRPSAQAVYYSVWWHVAIHILSALPGTQSREKIIQHLGLAPEVVDRSLAFLMDNGLVIEKAGRYAIGTPRVHLGTSSPLLPRHHANWRMRAIQAVDHCRPGDLHYSGVIGISRKDGERIREHILELLQKTEPILRESKEEAPYALLMDWFEI